MFYDQLIRICKERNVKPTPLIKSLGLSSGNPLSARDVKISIPPQMPYLSAFAAFCQKLK